MILLDTKILTLRLRHWILLELRALFPMSFLIEFLKIPASDEVFGKKLSKILEIPFFQYGGGHEGQRLLNFLVWGWEDKVGRLQQMVGFLTWQTSPVTNLVRKPAELTENSNILRPE